jgi:hypothetical protein
LGGEGTLATPCGADEFDLDGFGVPGAGLLRRLPDGVDKIHYIGQLLRIGAKGTYVAIEGQELDCTFVKDWIDTVTTEEPMQDVGINHPGSVR